MSIFDIKNNKLLRCYNLSKLGIYTNFYEYFNFIDKKIFFIDSDIKIDVDITKINIIILKSYNYKYIYYNTIFIEKIHKSFNTVKSKILLNTIIPFYIKHKFKIEKLTIKYVD